MAGINIGRDKYKASINRRELQFMERKEALRSMKCIEVMQIALAGYDWSDRIYMEKYDQSDPDSGFGIEFNYPESYYQGKESWDFADEIVAKINSIHHDILSPQWCEFDGSDGFLHLCFNYPPEYYSLNELLKRLILKREFPDSEYFEIAH